MMRESSGKKTVFVAMSGGVDSSVAAALLKKRGFDVTGIHIKGYNIDGCGESEAEDARRAAEVLRIPFYVFDFEKEYKEKVVAYMIDGYRRGITPNPDVMCNKEIKFGLFLKKALEAGANYVATGHYVRSGIAELPTRTAVLSLQRRAPATSRSENPPTAEPIFSELRSFSMATRQHPRRYSLFVAKDENKDQSYFLWTLTQGQLKHCLFPIGDYLKPEVRAMARKFGLPNAEKKDSQGICFLGKVSLRDFLSDYIPEKQGLILDTSGQVIGKHYGVHFYTIGQRHLGVGCKAPDAKGDNKPHYVVEKDAKENAILVAPENDPALYRSEVELRSVNFVSPIINYQLPITVYARIRYRQPLASATLIVSRQSPVISCRLVFDKPQKFVALGQSAVFYLPAAAAQSGAKEGSSKLEMLGGGIII